MDIHFVSTLTPEDEEPDDWDVVGLSFSSRGVAVVRPKG
jgi:hypothetical protein